MAKLNILKATFSLVKNEGIEKLSANNIAKEANISKGGFFHHFPTIKDLHLYVINSMIQQYEQEVPITKYKTFKSYMKAATDFTFIGMEQAPEMYALFFHFMSRIQHNKQFHQRLVQYMDVAFKDWGEKLNRFWDRPLSKSKLDTIIRMIDMYFAGLSIHFSINPDKKKYLKVTNEFCEMLDFHLKNL